MSVRSIRVEQALQVIPEIDGLLPLRSALVRGSRDADRWSWAATDGHSIVDTRLVDLDELDRSAVFLAEQLRDRVVKIYGYVIDATRYATARDWNEAALALIAAGELEEGAGNGAAAAGFFEKALEIGRKARDRTGELLARRRLGRVARSRGKFSEALDQYRASFRLAQGQRDLEGMVIACQGIGNVHSDLGAWEAAVEWFERGLDLLGETPSRHHWQFQVNLSNVERRSGNLAASESWLELARSSADRLGDTSAEIFLANSAGLLAMARSDTAVAERLYLRALAAAATPAARATVLVNFTECLLEGGRTDESESVARDLERIATVHSLVTFLPYVYRALGAVARTRMNEDGFVFFEQALQLCDDLDAPPLEVALTHHEYGRFEAALGRYDAAAAHLGVAERLYVDIGTTAELERLAADRARFPDHDSNHAS
jgi:tetratricopeptide (TPR) repeat protein